MKISQIIIRKRFETGPLAAIVSVIFNGVLAVHDVKVAYRPNGGLIAIMPKNEKGRDVAHPLNEDFRRYLEEEITKKLA